MSNKQTDSYYTVAENVRVKVPVGACRFYASVSSVSSEDEAKQFIASVSEEFRDATHNAWAYRLGVGDLALVRSSDDGEPANTAGPPIEQAIEAAGVTNVAVVVTRYFGGVKLGVGGLIRAYRGTAAEGLKAAGRVRQQMLREVYIAPLEYSQLGDAIHLLESVRGEVINIKYGQTVTLVGKVPPVSIDELKCMVRDATRGQARLQVGDILWQKAE